MQNKTLIFLILALFLAVSEAALATQTYTLSTADIANPERGFFEQTYAYVAAPQTPATLYTPLQDNLNLSQFGLLTARKITVVQRLISLKNFIAPVPDTDTLPSAFLNSVANDFTQARDRGIKLYVRFAYDFEGVTPSVPITRIIAHIQQLAPLLVQNADVITHLDAGMLGAYGEWYPGFPAPMGTDALRAQVINAWLAVLPPDRTIALRTPLYKQTFLNSPVALSSGFDASPASRIGHHNDCFLRSISDLGTFDTLNPDLRAQQRQYLRDENRFVPQSGETCGFFTTTTFEICGADENCANLSDCPNAVLQVAKQRWSLLNTRQFPGLVIPPGAPGFPAGGLWHQAANACYPEIKKSLGYRIQLVRSELPASASVGSCGWNASVTVRNVGSAAPFNPRGLKLVLEPVAGGSPVQVDLLQPNSSLYDPRRWLPDAGEITFGLGSQLPSNLSPGSYRLHLFLPDGRFNLETVPAYAIQTANVGLWNMAKGWNSLNHSVAITPCTSFSIAGNLAGLNLGASVTLSNTVSGENLVRSANGAFAFATAQLSGTNYNVIVQTQPSEQTCSVSNGSGTVAMTSVSNIAVNCSSNNFLRDGFE